MSLPVTYSPSEVAEELGCSSRTVERAIERRELRASRLAQRGCWAIEAGAVLDWLDLRANRPREHTPPKAAPIDPGRAGQPPTRSVGGAPDGMLRVPPARRKDAA